MMQMLIRRHAGSSLPGDLTHSTQSAHVRTPAHVGYQSDSHTHSATLTSLK